MKGFLTGLAAALFAVPVMAGDQPKALAAEAAATLVIGPGQATATPVRQGTAHTGGGNIHVTQPSPDSIKVTMTGVAVAKPHPCKESVAGLSFELAQCFEVVFNDPKIKGAKLIMWGRTVGMLRSDSCCCQKCGSAEISTPAHAALTCGPTGILALDLPPRSVHGGDNVSIHDREGPVWLPVVPGKYTLHQVFGITARHCKALFGKPASAEFAPEPALDADWISKKEPFHGAVKKDFGFQVILKVVAEEEADNKEP